MKDIRPRLIELLRKGYCTPQISVLAKKLGEASIAASAALLGPGKGNPKNGGTQKKIIRYIVFPGSGDGKPKSTDVIDASVAGRLHALSREQVIAVCT